MGFCQILWQVSLASRGCVIAQTMVNVLFEFVLRGALSLGATETWSGQLDPPWPSDSQLWPLSPGLGRSKAHTASSCAALCKPPYRASLEHG